MQETFITKLRINQVRHVKNIEMLLSQDQRKHLILTGKNGCGKTAVLEALKFFFENGIAQQAQIECTFTTDDDWREQIRRNEFVVICYKSDVEFWQCAEPSPLERFSQYLIRLQAQKAFALNDGDTKTTEQIDRWFNMFEATLQDLFDDTSLQFMFDRDTFNFSIRVKHRELFDLSSLSDGYASVLAILGTLIMRMNNTYEKPGVVLIDDVGTHLHFELQDKILPLLIHVFPNLQFIVSTHSPIILNSLGNAVVYDLENRLRRENLSYESPKARQADIAKYSDQIRRVIDEYEKLLGIDEKTETEEFRLLELRNYLTWITHKML